MKLCIDCKHSNRPEDAQETRCVNPRYARISPVDGTTKPSFCAIQRSSFGNDACGELARGFEPKEGA